MPHVVSIYWTATTVVALMSLMDDSVNGVRTILLLIIILFIGYIAIYYNYT